MDTTKHRRLQELDRSDFKIVDGEPDIRGWDVKNGAGQKIGEVEELIVDAQKKKVRYMVVDLDDNELKLDHRKVLIPIGLAELHKEDDDVLLPAVTVDQLTGLPAYDKDNLDDEAEQRICNTLGRNTTTLAQHIMGSTESHADHVQVTGNDTARHTTHPTKAADKEDAFYQHDYFHDDNLYKHRLHETQQKQAKEDSEYEKGLRLWEMRSEGGVIAGDSSREREREREVNEEKHMEMVRNRRKSYEERRGYPHRDDRRDDYRDDRREADHEHHHRKDNTIIGRIRDEGLRDA
jgi:hypothetical protein